MNWDWVEEMKELVGNATENGYKIDHNSFLNNIIRPNLRKLQVDCRDPEFAITDEYLHLHNEYLFASAIFERGSPEALAEIAGGFRDLYLRRTN